MSTVKNILRFSAKNFEKRKIIRSENLDQKIKVYGAQRQSIKLKHPEEIINERDGLLKKKTPPMGNVNRQIWYFPRRTFFLPLIFFSSFTELSYFIFSVASLSLSFLSTAKTSLGALWWKFTINERRRLLSAIERLKRRETSQRAANNDNTKQKSCGHCVVVVGPRLQLQLHSLSAAARWNAAAQLKMVSDAGNVFDAWWKTINLDLFITRHAGR